MGDDAASRLRAVLDGMTPGPWLTRADMLRLQGHEPDAWDKGAPIYDMPTWYDEDYHNASIVVYDEGRPSRADACGIVALRNAGNALVALVEAAEAIVRGPYAVNTSELERVLARVRDALPVAAESSDG